VEPDYKAIRYCGVPIQAGARVRISTGNHMPIGNQVPAFADDDGKSGCSRERVFLKKWFNAQGAAREWIHELHLWHIRHTIVSENAHD
jgi:hypothetical protein